MQALALALTTLWLVTAPAAAAPPPLPDDVPTLLVGSEAIAGTAVTGHRATFVMGRVDKTGPLALGEQVAPGALQESVLERIDTTGSAVLRRTTRVRRPGSDEILLEASIDMDPLSLKPISARTVRGDQTSTVTYDWETFTLRRTPGAEGAESDTLPLDLAMLEVGAHDVWMAALPWRDGYSARIPAVFASTGAKYWAVPRVVGSETIDIGDGEAREAWVVELDWWGMGAANTVDNYSPGGGANDTAGTGGKYWVLKESIEGTPRVVRVRTEMNPETDSVIQLQSGV